MQLYHIILKPCNRFVKLRNMLLLYKSCTFSRYMVLSGQAYFAFRSFIMKRLLLAIICIAMLFSACSEDTGEWIDPSTLTKSPAAETTPVQPDQPVQSEDPSPAESAVPIVTEAPLPVSVDVLAAGDLMCLYGQLLAAKKGNDYEFDYCFAEVKGLISAADLAIANLETLVAEGYEYTGAQRGNPNPKMNAPDSYLSAVLGSGFDVLVNSNNHICDRGTDGIDKTIKNMDEQGVAHTGAYALGEQRKQLIVDVKGIKIAILGYLDHLNGFPGEYQPEQINMYTDELAAADIAEAKSEGADFIIVYMHWGTENTTKLTEAQKQQAKFVADAGADIIIGSHPHCPQGTENIETDHGTVPVFYSLGNVISSMARDINNDTAFVNISLEKDPSTGKTAIASLTYTPAFCTRTDAGRFVLIPADAVSASERNSRDLDKSRERTIKAVGSNVAQPN